VIGLSVDPGMMNGLCVFEWGDEQPFTIKSRLQFPGGAAALRDALDRLDLKATKGRGLTPYPAMKGRRLDALVMEKFTPRQNEGFNLSLEDVEPLRAEGVMIDRHLETFIHWREPSQQYFMGGEDLADRRKRARAFLAEHDLLPTGSTVGQKDANDAISATLHAIAWLRRQRHMPTIEALFPRKDATR
jgi:hypothetical protein